MQVKYRAKRSLNTVDSPAHIEGTEYTITVSLQSFDRIRKPKRVTVTSLSGVSQTTYERGETHRRCKTIPVTGSDLANLREFLDSVEDGARFEFDDGAGFVSCLMESKGYTESRDVQLGSGGDSDYFSLGWTHREVG